MQQNFEYRPQKTSQIKLLQGRLVSDKFTFLKSNQLITQYVQNGNVIENRISKKDQKTLNSYIQCQHSMKAFERDNLSRREKLLEFQLFVKKRVSRISHQQANRQIQLENQVAQIELMTEDMDSKVADIMLGRNVNIFSREPLQNWKKQSKYRKNTIQKCLEKTLNIRKNMLIKSNKVRKNQLMKSTRNISRTNIEESSFNSSINSSLSCSVSEIMKEEDISSLKTSNLKRKISQKSFDTIYNQQRRNAATKAFGTFWNLDCQDKALIRQGKYKNTNTNKNKNTNQNSQGKIIKSVKINQSIGLNTKDLQKFFSSESRCKLQGSKLYKEKFKKVENQYNLNQTVLQN